MAHGTADMQAFMKLRNLVGDLRKAMEAEVRRRDKEAGVTQCNEHLNITVTRLMLFECLAVYEGRDGPGDEGPLVTVDESATLALAGVAGMIHAPLSDDAFMEFLGECMAQRVMATGHIKTALLPDRKLDG